MPTDDGRLPIAETSVDVAAGVSGALVGLAAAGPLGAVSGAAAGPIVKASLVDLVARIARRRNARIEAVIAVAAELAGVPATTLVERLESDPAREALLIRTLRAAQDEAVIEDLVALAMSLSKANEAGYSEPQLAWETAFVRAVAECDISHAKLLASFLTTYDALNLGDAAGPNTSIEGGLNSGQLDMANRKLALGDTLDYLLATLERLGLVRKEVTGAPAPPMITRVNATWRVTDFGRQFVQRMDEVENLLAEAANRSTP